MQNLGEQTECEDFENRELKRFYILLKVCTLLAVYREHRGFHKVNLNPGYFTLVCKCSFKKISTQYVRSKTGTISICIVLLLLSFKMFLERA